VGNWELGSGIHFKMIAKVPFRGAQTICHGLPAAKAEGFLSQIPTGRKLISSPMQNLLTGMR
jgi:hypothetical protein